MTRPAQPGDRCFLVRDPEHDGRNIGKTCIVLHQCTCDPGEWKVETLEPWTAWSVQQIPPVEICVRARFPAGECLCVPKPDLRPIDDPDLKEPEDVSHPTPTEHRDPHPAAAGRG